MKKILVLLFAGCIFVGGVAAQEFGEVEEAFGQFAKDLSSALPFASTIGLNWSDSYIGNFPHLGVAVGGGAVGLPAEAFGKVLGTLSGGELGSDLLSFLPPELEEFGDSFGMPFPALPIVEARLGGFFLPFDIGVKVGFIPEDVDTGEILPAGMGFDYELFGADVRFRIIEERGLIPELIVGGGINFLRGGLSFATGEDIAIGGFEVPNEKDLSNPNTYDISLKAPEFGFDWETTVFDVKAQLSKRLFIITPYIGIGMTMGSSTVGGGAYTEVQAFKDGVPISDEEWNEIATALQSYGQEVPQLTKEGFTISAKESGFATRVYGGTSINLLFLKLDLTGFYELLSESLGLSAALRLQF